MSAHPMTIYRSGPAFDTKPDARVEVAAATCIANSDRVAMRWAKEKGPVIEITRMPVSAGTAIAAHRFARLRGRSSRRSRSKPPSWFRSAGTRPANARQPC